MSNQFRTEIQEEKPEEDDVTNEPLKRGIPDNWFTMFLRKGVISTDMATSALPFVLFVACLGMMYIGNMHMAENNIRDIDKLSKEVKELGWDYKTAKADLAHKSTLTEVIARADSLGLKEQLTPPQKILVKEYGQ